MGSESSARDFEFGEQRKDRIELSGLEEFFSDNHEELFGKGLSIKQAVFYYGETRRSLKIRVQEGEIPAIRLPESMGRKWRVFPDGVPEQLLQYIPKKLRKNRERLLAAQREDDFDSEEAFLEEPEYERGNDDSESAQLEELFAVEAGEPPALRQETYTAPSILHLIEDLAPQYTVENFAPQSLLEEYYPQTPVTDLVPQTPVTDLVPQTPVTDLVSQTPVTDLVSQTPVTDLVPETPVTDLVPETPVTDLVPETPVITDLVPATPVTDLVPETPVTDLVPETPVTDLVPETPVTDLVPETPVITDLVPATPVTDLVPETPVTDLVPETPVTDLVPETPVTDLVPATPVADLVPQTPVEPGSAEVVAEAQSAVAKIDEPVTQAEPAKKSARYSQLQDRVNELEKKLADAMYRSNYLETRISGLEDQIKFLTQQNYQSRNFNKLMVVLPVVAALLAFIAYRLGV